MLVLSSKVEKTSEGSIIQPQTHNLINKHSNKIRDEYGYNNNVNVFPMNTLEQNNVIVKHWQGTVKIFIFTYWIWSNYIFLVHLEIHFSKTSYDFQRPLAHQDFFFTHYIFKCRRCFQPYLNLLFLFWLKKLPGLRKSKIWGPWDSKFKGFFGLSRDSHKLSTLISRSGGDMRWMGDPSNFNSTLDGKSGKLSE